MLALLEAFVKYDELIDFDAEFVILSEVTFLKDFGPFKTGDKLDTLQLVSHDGVVRLEELDSRGSVWRTVNVRLEVA